MFVSESAKAIDALSATDVALSYDQKENELKQSGNLIFRINLLYFMLHEIS